MSSPLAHPIIALALQTLSGGVAYANARERVRTDPRLRHLGDAGLAELLDSATEFWKHATGPRESTVVYPFLIAECAKERLQAIGVLRRGAAPADRDAVDARWSAWATRTTHYVLNQAMASLVLPDLRVAFNIFVEAEALARAMPDLGHPRFRELFHALLGQYQVAAETGQDEPRRMAHSRLDEVGGTDWWALEGEATHQRLREEFRGWYQARVAVAERARAPEPPSSPNFQAVLQREAERVASGTAGFDDAVRALVAAVGESGVQDGQAALAADLVVALAQADPEAAVLRGRLLTALIAALGSRAGPTAAALAARGLGCALFARAKPIDDCAGFSEACSQLGAALAGLSDGSHATLAADAAVWLGLANRGLGDFGRARDCAQEAIERFSALPEAKPSDLAAAYANRADAGEQLGQTLEALRDFSTALELFADAHDVRNVKRALADIARLASRTGHSDEVIAAGHVALPLIAESADVEGAARIGIVLIRNALRTGRRELVADTLDRVERLLHPLLERPEPSPEIVELYGDLQYWHGLALATLVGVVPDDWETYDWALERLENARSIAAKMGDDDRIARAVLQMGYAAVRAGHPGPALERTGMLDMLRCTPSNLADRDQISGMAYAQMGDQALALQCLDRALAGVEGHPDREFSLHALIGDVHSQRGDVEAARDAYERAVAIFEGERALMGDESRVGFQANATQIYTRLVHLYAGELHDPERALHWTERAKSRAFVELLGLSHIPVPDVPAEYRDLIAREHAMLQKVHGLRARLTATDEPGPAALTARLELFDATRELGAIWAELGDVLPDYAALRTGAVAEWRSIQQQLERTRSETAS